MGKVSQKYLKEFLELLPVQDLNNQGRAAEWSQSVILEFDMPTQCPLHTGEVSCPLHTGEVS